MGFSKQEYWSGLPFPMGHKAKVPGAHENSNTVLFQGTRGWYPKAVGPRRVIFAQQYEQWAGVGKLHFNRKTLNINQKATAASHACPPAKHGVS